MLALIESHPNTFRLIAFVSFFALFAVSEYAFPRRKLTVSKYKRWTNNLCLTFLNTFVLRFVFPVSAAAFALFCQQKGIGIFNWVSLPFALSVFLSILILDAVIYYQHYLFHTIPTLWRLHQVHHVDLNLDVSSAARFHTLEMILSMLVKFVAIALLGAPALAVVVFEVILSSLAMFNHANMALPENWDKKIRLLLVTPDMHRVHHSVIYKENNSNFGFCLSIWDRLFSTYIAEPKEGQLGMKLGLKAVPNENDTVPLLSLLILPFKRQNTGK